MRAVEEFCEDTLCKSPGFNCLDSSLIPMTFQTHDFMLVINLHVSYLCLHTGK